MFSPICNFSTDLINVLSGAVFLYPMKKRNISLHCCRIEWRTDLGLIKILSVIIYFTAGKEPMSQSSSSVRNATNLWIFCFRDYLYAFRKTLCPVRLAH